MRTLVVALLASAASGAKFVDSWEKFCGETDCYTELGVAPTATKAQIRRAYRALTTEHHPDKNPGNAKALVKFNAIARAYEVLTDDDKRKKLDYYTENPDEYWSLYGNFVKVVYAPKTDIRFALLIILLFVSCIQPALQLSKHQFYVKAMEKACLNRLTASGGGSAESIAIRAEADEAVKAAAVDRKKAKKPKLSGREERDLLISIINDLILKSNLPAEYAYPTVADVLIVKMLKAPFAAAEEKKRKAGVAARVAAGGAVSEDEQQELIEAFLGGADAWDALSASDQDSLFAAKAYTKGAFDAWRSKHPATEKAASVKAPSKQELRQRKKGAPRFVMED